MTTLTINENVKLSRKNFDTYDELVTFVLYDNSILELEELNKWEETFLNKLNSYKDFKDKANFI